MKKYVTNIKDLVIYVLKNGSEIETKAESGDTLSCFQMGMMLTKCLTLCEQTLCEHVISHLFAMETYLITNKEH